MIPGGAQPGIPGGAQPEIPTGAQPGAEGKPTQESDLDQLAKLIFGISRTEIRALQQLVKDKSLFGDHMSATLGDAVRKASEDKSFKNSMSPVVAEGVLQTARREPIKLGDAIAPALAPAIRGMISLALDKMNQRIEAQIKTSFSIQGLKWRLESKRTGVPLSEIVLRDTMVFRVDHVLLIHQQTGTLLAQASQPDVVGKDPAVVSSMLTAVGDFVVDAFGDDDASESDARSYRVGDLTAFVETSGELALAAVVRGSPTTALRERLKDVVERLSLMCGDMAYDFNGDVGPFGVAAPLLEDCLVAETKRKKEKTVSAALSLPKLMGLSIMLGLLGWIGFQLYKTHVAEAQWSAFENDLRNQVGFIVIDVVQEDNMHLVRGLYDSIREHPQYLAEKHGYQNDEVRWELRPFISVEESIVIQRARRILDPPDSIQLTFFSGALSATGTAPREWIDHTEAIANAIPGVRELSITEVTDSTRRRSEHLLGSIRNVHLFFESKEIEVASISEPQVDQLREAVGELSRLLGPYRRSLRLVAHVDPRTASRLPEEDRLRAQARVEYLSESIEHAIVLRGVDVSEDPPSNPLPYLTLSAEVQGDE